MEPLDSMDPEPLIDIQRAYEDMDDMIDAIEKGDLLMLDEKEGLRLLVVKQRALSQALADNKEKDRLLLAAALKNTGLENDNTVLRKERDELAEWITTRAKWSKCRVIYLPSAA